MNDLDLVNYSNQESTLINFQNDYDTSDPNSLGSNIKNVTIEIQTINLEDISEQDIYSDY